jgi:hypothetical protein
MHPLCRFLPTHEIGGKLPVHTADDASTHDPKSDQKRESLAKPIPHNVADMTVVSSYE